MAPIPHAAATFESHRTHLRALAYRMTGSLSEAEDILQEACLKWCRVAEPIDNPRAYLSKLVARLCLDWLKSSRVRREAYVGPWLPEPIIDADVVRPDLDTELAHDISVALMLALERLSPLERAAFLLHDVFDVDYGEVAEVLSRSEAACRQLAARARTHLRGERARHTPSAAEARRVYAAFSAATNGNLVPLQRVLAEDACLYTDGGGKVTAALRPIWGRERILRFIAGLLRKYYTVPPKPRLALINDQPGLILSDDERVLQTLAFELRERRLCAIYVVRNPDKLASVMAPDC